MTTIKNNINAFKNIWLTYGQIQKLIKSEDDMLNWRVLSEKQMNNFITNEL